MYRFALVFMMLVTGLAVGCGEPPGETDIEEQGRRQLVVDNNTAVGACSYWCVNAVPACFATCNAAHSSDTEACKTCCNAQCVGDTVKVLCRHACETHVDHLTYGLQCLRSHGSGSLLACIDCCQDVATVVR